MTIFAGDALSGAEIVRSRSTSESTPGAAVNVTAANVGVAAAALAGAISASEARTIARRILRMRHPLSRRPDCPTLSQRAGTDQAQSGQGLGRSVDTLSV